MQPSISSIEVPEHKRWASSLSEDEFHHEFIRRHPNADSVPIRDEYMTFQQPPSRLIDPVDADSLLAEDYTPVVDSVEIEETGGKVIRKTYICRGNGCERTFNVPIARIAHERRCKFALNTKLEPTRHG